MKVSTKILIGAALAWAGAAIPAHADVKAGVDKWGQGDYAGAVAEWRGPAQAGDADAQFNLGQAYKLGRGVPMDLRQAESWYKRAADQGHLQAADNYGLLLFQDNRRDEARPFLEASAARGEPRAQYVLGTGHFNGDFVAKDWVRAYALMTRASASGLPQATSNLAQMDRFIPLDQRQKATELAAKMEQEEARTRNMQVAGLPPRRPSGPVQTAQLPPSQPATPPPSVPVPAPLPPAGATPLPPAPAPAPVATAAAPVVASSGGNWRIQLGAFGNQNNAKALWSRLESRVSGLASLQPYLVQGGNVTRLQAGPFATKSQAEAMCGSVKDAGNACIVKAR